MTAIGRIMASGGVLLLALLGWTGCRSGPGFDYVGTWRGMRKVEGRPGADPDVLRSIGKVDLRITPDGRFAVYVAPLSLEGNIERTAHGLRLIPDAIMGRALSRQPPDVRDNVPRLELEPRPDGTLRLRDPKQPSQDVVLTREAKPGG